MLIAFLTLNLERLLLQIVTLIISFVTALGLCFFIISGEVQFPPPIDTERIESSGLAERIEGIKVNLIFIIQLF